MPRLAALLDHARAVTASSAPAWVAVLDPAGSRAVAFERPKNRTEFEHALEAAGIAHARVRGWVAFSRQRDAVDAVRRRSSTSSTLAGFTSRPDGADASFLCAGYVTADAHATPSWHADGSGVPGARRRAAPARRVIPRGTLSRRAAVHDGAAELDLFGVAGVLETRLRPEGASLARLAPGDAVVFARAGEPVPGVTLLATGATSRVVRELAPGAVAEPTTLDGVPLRVVSLGPVDLYAGSFDGRSVVTDDPDVRLRSKVEPLRPPGLPEATSAWAYLDVPDGLPALESLAALAGTHLSTRFVARVAPLRPPRLPHLYADARDTGRRCARTALI